MLVLLKAKKSTKVSFLNNKKEQIIEVIPENRWVILESLTNTSQIINYDVLIAENVTIQSSSWNDNLPFNRLTEKIRYFRESNNSFIRIDGLFDDIKAISKDAALEVTKAFDTRVQKSESDKLLEINSDTLKGITKKIASVKLMLNSSRLTDEDFETEILAIRKQFILSTTKDLDSYISDVFNFDIPEEMDVFYQNEQLYAIAMSLYKENAVLKKEIETFKKNGGGK